jgi:hypothetical protein
VFRGFHQVDQVVEPSVSGEFVGQIVPRNLANGRDFDLAFLHSVVASHFYMGSLPDAHADGHFAALDAGAEFPGEVHVVALLRSLRTASVVCYFKFKRDPQLAEHPTDLWREAKSAHDCGRERHKQADLAALRANRV